MGKGAEPGAVAAPLPPPSPQRRGGAGLGCSEAAAGALPTGGAERGAPCGGLPPFTSCPEEEGAAGESLDVEGEASASLCGSGALMLRVSPGC